MKMESFRVGPYRNIIDSGSVVVDPAVTVLVGKNESGKTNLLHALHSVNPAVRGRAIPRLDYPRWLQKRHERSGDYEQAKPIEVSFALCEDDIEAIEGRFGPGVLLDAEFEVFRTYESDAFEHIRPRCDVQAAIRNCLNGLEVQGAPDIESLRGRLEADAAELDADGQRLPIAEASAEALDRLEETFGEHPTVGHAVGSALRDRVPRFFYFDDYAQLPGTTDVAPLIEAIREPNAPSLTVEQQTALALLRMGFADDEIIAEDYDARKAELQAVGAELTQLVLSYWKQNPNLRLAVDINPVPDRDSNGERVVRRELKLDVMDERHFFTNSLQARSSGFRWFVSFVAAFSEFEDDGNVIVLLDEPGLGLHARAQEDFLRFIEDRLADRHQTLFTTHSPFMVDPSHLERVRVVEDLGPETGTRVTTPDGASKDPDTLFPLQAALGYDIAQNLFVGADNLVVEGLSDYTYLTVMSDHLKSLGRQGLDERWRILPVGGASNIPTFVALLGRSLDVSVLIDGNQSGNQKIRNLINAGLLDGTRLISPGAASPTPSADIEDLFSDGDYLLLYNSAFGAKLKVSDISGDGRIIRRIESAAAPFDHNAPARCLLHSRMQLLGRLSARTLDRFERLLTEINGTLKAR